MAAPEPEENTTFLQDLPDTVQEHIVLKPSMIKTILHHAYAEQELDRSRQYVGLTHVTAATVASEIENPDPQSSLSATRSSGLITRYRANIDKIDELDPILTSVVSDPPDRKEPDASWIPATLPAGRTDKWPSVVLEVVIIVWINPREPFLALEQFRANSNSGTLRNQGPHFRNYPRVVAHCAQRLDITESEGNAVGTGAPLVVRFADIFLCGPENQWETDLVISQQDLEAIALKQARALPAHPVYHGGGRSAATHQWKIQVSVSGAKDEELQSGYEIAANVLISGVGQLSQPFWPEIHTLLGVCRRLLSSDDHYAALNKDHVKLETREMQRITETGIETETAEFDLIVRELSQAWDGGATAYYGVTVEDMPNFGLLYGPNTSLGHSSIILMIEAQSRYLATLIDPIVRAKERGEAIAIQPRTDVVQRFTRELQERLAKSTFADPSCNSWYKAAAGRITNNWPGTAVVEYQQALSWVRWSDYLIEGDENRPC
ncbi:hypothetical protein BJX76DRAFT_360078 [Aspergillus varians]